MATRVESTLELDAPIERLAPRLAEWSWWSGYSCTGRGDGSWSFCRGRFWRAWFSWDIEFLPTLVVVEVIGRDPLTVRAFVQVEFANRNTTPAVNEADVREEMGLLLAYVRGLYDVGVQTPEPA